MYEIVRPSLKVATVGSMLEVEAETAGRDHLQPYQTYSRMNALIIHFCEDLMLAERR